MLQTAYLMTSVEDVGLWSLAVYVQSSVTVWSLITLTMLTTVITLTTLTH